MNMAKNNPEKLSYGDALIDFQDGRDDTQKIYRLLNEYISKHNSNDFEKCVKIAVDVYDNILTFLNVCEEEW